MVRCALCHPDASHVVWHSDHVWLLRDETLPPPSLVIAPRAHLADWFHANPALQRALLDGLERAKERLAAAADGDRWDIRIASSQGDGPGSGHFQIQLVAARQGRPTGPTVDADAGPFAELARFVAGEGTPFIVPLTRAIELADEIDILSAFVQDSGLVEVLVPLSDALERGVVVRLLTGDYLGITHPHALHRLYRLAAAHPQLQVRLYRCQPGESFHAKAYVFRRGRHSAAFVGSSNLSRKALTDGIEWNLRTPANDSALLLGIQRQFDRLFSAPVAMPLTRDLLDAYQSRVRVPAQPEPAAPRPTPHDIQQQVLERLTATRADGARRGLVVMATGLGKTYLSAFDFERMGGRKALFVAHREEILRQAAESWAEVFPDRSIGFLTGDEKTPEAHLLFASVQTLSRARHLRGFDPHAFDYVVIDEFHHAAANSYRKLLAHFVPRFLLGLTATPDRLDGAALLALCDDNLVAQVGLVEGIARSHLVPFHYYGVRDGLDFEVIPWRSGRFDVEALTKAAATRDRAAQALSEYKRRSPAERRSLIFCCSQRHADFVADYFREHGVQAVAVHSGNTSAPRARSLKDLEDGRIEAIVAVDVFNEGVDLPDVNTILMLRPTESPVVFMQQLGRGLRRGRKIAKPHLTVIDFIGNHRSFLVKPQALVALTGQSLAPGEAVRRLRDNQVELPAGCSIEIETEAFDLLERVAQLSGTDKVMAAYLRLRDALGRRPTAKEMFAAEGRLTAVRRGYGTWFHFLDRMDDLAESEQVVLQAHEDWFRDLTGMKMERSFVMATLLALVELDSLHDSTTVDTVTTGAQALLKESVVLQADLSDLSELDEAASSQAWRRLALRPLHDAKGTSRRWFSLEDDTLVSRLAVEAELQSTFDQMSAELLELRLAAYAERKLRYSDTVVPLVAPLHLAVGHVAGNPIIRLDRTRRPDTPSGEVRVHVEDKPYLFRFGRTTVSVATERPGGPNLLPVLLRRWLGPTAGQPGTRHWVSLRQSRGRWALRPVEESGVAGSVLPFAQVPFYPELAVACGVATAQFEGHDVSTPLAVVSDRTLSAQRHFVVRAQGDSMNGGTLPIRDGNLVLCEWATVTDLHSVAGKPLLLTGGTDDEILSTLKIPIRRADGIWVLRSANPSFPDRALDPTVTLRVVARALEVVQQAAGPTLWGRYDRDAIAALFGHRNNPSWRTGHRDVEVDSKPHTVLMVSLRKPRGTPLEHMYADRFVSPREFQWESQATTRIDSAKGRRILHHADEGRQIHLFVRYHTKTAAGTGEPFVYCGTLRTLRHEGELPIRVWFELEQPLPAGLWQAWERW